MVIKTELCSFSEWRIYPGHGIRFVAKDGRLSIFINQKAKILSLRKVSKSNIPRSKPNNFNGLLPGDVSTRRSRLTKVPRRSEEETLESKEPLSESHSKKSEESERRTIVYIYL